MSLEIYILEGFKELTSEAGTAYPSGTSPVFSGVRVTRSLVLYVCFANRCLSFCTFSFGHCVVCSSSIYGFRLSLWYFQTLLSYKNKSVKEIKRGHVLCCICICMIPTLNKNYLLTHLLIWILHIFLNTLYLSQSCHYLSKYKLNRFVEKEKACNTTSYAFIVQKML